MPQPCLEGAAEETIWHLSTKTRRVWNAYAQPDTTCPQSGRSDSKATLKILTLAELDKSYPATAWTQVFTDGSATRNGGCGIYTRQPNKPPITLAILGGDLCSTYRAESQALLTATETVTQLETRTTFTPKVNSFCYFAYIFKLLLLKIYLCTFLYPKNIF